MHSHLIHRKMNVQMYLPNVTGEKRRAQRSQRNTRVICTRIKVSRIYHPSANEGKYDSDTPRRECDDRVLSGENECAEMAWPELRTNVMAHIF
jgi:hypothetical protein